MSDPIPQLTRLAHQFLVHSFLYYQLNESLISDPLYDSISQALRTLRSQHPKAEIPHAKLIDKTLSAMDSTDSGYSIKTKDYPPEITTLAFQLLYQEKQPSTDFKEFVERRGFRLEK